MQYNGDSLKVQPAGSLKRSLMIMIRTPSTAEPARVVEARNNVITGAFRRNSTAPRAGRALHFKPVCNNEWNMQELVLCSLVHRTVSGVGIFSASSSFALLLLQLSTVACCCRYRALFFPAPGTDEKCQQSRSFAHFSTSVRF